jgi:hypothetical protein
MIRCVRHVARIGEMRNTYKILIEIPERKRHLGDLVLQVRVILKRMLYSSRL